MSIRDRAAIDFLPDTGFSFFIHRLPKTSFTVQKVAIPGIYLDSPAVVNPFVNIPKAGEHILYNELSLLFIVDEQIKNYLEIHDWIRGLGKPESFQEYADLTLEPGTGVASDCLLSILDAKKNPKFEVTFRDAVPISLSDLTFDATTTDMSYLRAEVLFKYRDFVVARV